MKEKEISKRTKIILGIVMLALVVTCIYQSYAIFKESRKLRFIWGVVEDFEQTPDIVVNVMVKYWDGTKYQEREEIKFPNKLTHEYREMTCTNSGNAEFDEDRWQMSIKNITEPTECTIKFVKLLTDEEKYGTSIPAYLANGSSVDLYTKGGLREGFLSDWIFDIPFSNGNYNRISNLWNLMPMSTGIPQKLNESQTSNGHAYIFQGLNTYSHNPSELNIWITFLLTLRGVSGYNASFTEFKLQFADGALLTIQQAVDQKYIQPLVLYASSNTVDSRIWTLTDLLNLGNSGGTETGPELTVYFKITYKSPLNAIQLNSSIDYPTSVTGYSITQYPNLDFSLVEYP